MHVQATFNNTIITFTDPIGNVIAWSSSGSLGFRGSRKGTPFAAQQASLTAANKAKECGDAVTVEVKVAGPGAGRESAVRALSTAGIEVQRDSRRHADSAQRLPAAQAPPRLIGQFHAGWRRTGPWCVQMSCQKSKQDEGRSGRKLHLDPLPMQVKGGRFIRRSIYGSL